MDHGLYLAITAPSFEMVEEWEALQSLHRLIVPSSL